MAKGSTSSGGAAVSKKPAAAATEAPELQDLGALAQQMEEQLMQEFETLLAARGAGTKQATAASEAQASASAASSTSKEQDARDAVYWRHMYERLRDLRETEAEKMLAEVTAHAEEREKALTDLVAHLEQSGSGTGASSGSGSGGGGGGGGSGRSTRRDVRLSDVSVAGFGGSGAAMETDEDDDEAAAAGAGKQRRDGRQEEEVAALKARVEALEAKTATLKRILLAYQGLTSVCIRLDAPPPAKARGAGERLSTLECTAINHVHRRALKFQLKMNCDQEDNYKVDAVFKPVGNTQLLPAQLREELTVETRQCPMLLRAVLGGLYKMDE